VKKLLWSLLFVWLEFSLAQPAITNVQFLPDLLGVDDPRFPLLSPDGKTIFYKQDTTLCFFEIDANSNQCHGYPEAFGGLGRYSSPVWSPDSARVVFTESFFDMFRESDVWQLDARTGDYTNLTDDDANDFDPFTREPDPKALIDYLPTFNSQGELYFFRSRLTSAINKVLGEKFSLELFKFTETNEAVRVSSLRPQLPVLSIYQPAAISPDGKQIAFIVLPPSWQDDKASGVWLQDLATGKREQILSLADFPETRPGASTEELPPFLPQQLRWVNEGLMITTENLVRGLSMKGNAFYLELVTKTITPLEDLSSFTPQDIYKETQEPSPFSRVPLRGVILPNNAHYLYIGSSGTGNNYFIWSRSLPLKDEEPQLLGTFPYLDDDETSTQMMLGGFDTPATVSKDGKRALILGYLLTLE
jgi:hypothetical protein